MTPNAASAALLALLGAVLAVPASANLALPYAYSAAGDVDDPNSLVEDMTFFGMATASAATDWAWAQTDLGIQRAGASGDGGGTWHGALSVWSDGFTYSGEPGTGTAQVSLSLDGLFAGADAAVSGYALLKTAYPVLPGDLYALLSGATTLPADMEVVLWDSRDNQAGAVHTVLTGSFQYGYGETFYLTSVFGVAASGNGAVDFGHTAEFGISGAGDLVTDSGTRYMAAAVPEAHEWAMLMAGLGLMGLRLRRRGPGSSRIAA